LRLEPSIDVVLAPLSSDVSKKLPGALAPLGAGLLLSVVVLADGVLARLAVPERT
jgi:hypothetical protein